MRYPTLIILLLLLGCNSQVKDNEKPNLEKLHAILNGEFKARAEPPDKDLAREPDPHLVPLHASGEIPYFTVGRKHVLGSDSCVECHDENHRKQFKPVKEPVMAHWNISLKHAGEGSMNCLTCHSNPDKTTLGTLEGAKVSFDRPDRVCSQCHFGEVEDWKNGSHGKSAVGWVQPRVLKNCTQCHNPHRPAFVSRFPSRILQTKEMLREDSGSKH